MNRYRYLRAGRFEGPGFGALLLAADQARAAGERGVWVIRGVVAAGLAGEGVPEDLGMLVVDKDGVELREIEPAEVGP